MGGPTPTLTTRLLTCGLWPTPIWLASVVDGDLGLVAAGARLLLSSAPRPLWMTQSVVLDPICSAAEHPRLCNTGCGRGGPRILATTATTVEHPPPLTPSLSPPPRGGAWLGVRFLNSVVPLETRRPSTATPGRGVAPAEETRQAIHCRARMGRCRAGWAGHRSRRHPPPLRSALVAPAPAGTLG